MNLIFCVLTYAIIYVLMHHVIFRFYLLKYSLFISTLVLTSSCRRSLYTFYVKCLHTCPYFVISYWLFLEVPLGFSKPLKLLPPPVEFTTNEFLIFMNITLNVPGTCVTETGPCWKMLVNRDSTLAFHWQSTVSANQKPGLKFLLTECIRYMI